jgi:hypothetical protein
MARVDEEGIFAAEQHNVVNYEVAVYSQLCRIAAQRHVPLMFKENCK